MSEIHTWGMIFVIALVTAATRFLPFLLWSGDRKVPALIEKLGKVLPYAIMGMLVVYCLKDISFLSAEGCIPAVVSCAVVGVIYVWRRNTLISIIAGTVCYMFLVQMVF